MRAHAAIFGTHMLRLSQPSAAPSGPSAPCRSSTARQDKAATPLPRGGHPGPNVDIVDIGGGCVKDQLAGLARKRPGCAHAVFGHCSGLAAAATGAPWPAISKKRVRPAVLAPTACWLLALRAPQRVMRALLQYTTGARRAASSAAGRAYRSTTPAVSLGATSALPQLFSAPGPSVPLSLRRPGSCHSRRGRGLSALDYQRLHTHWPARRY